MGTVTHKLNLAGKELEIYEYPAGCAKRYDGIDSEGGAFAQGFTQMSEDRNRIVRVRMEEEECASLEITGTSDCGNLAAGYAFTLQGHSNGDGEYLLTRVEHSARQSGYRTEEKDEFSYRQSLRLHARRADLPPAAGHTEAGDRGRPDRHGDRAARRDDVRPERLL